LTVRGGDLVEAEEREQLEAQADAERAAAELLIALAKAGQAADYAVKHGRILWCDGDAPHLPHVLAQAARLADDLIEARMEVERAQGRYGLARARLDPEDRKMTDLMATVLGEDARRTILGEKE
jgi:hypothetical protein